MSQPRANYTTVKGTILPLLNLKGKEYLQVPHRLVWFREELPTWRIETSLVEFDGTHAVSRAVIKDDQGNIMATAHKSETVNGFPDFIEKSETGAVGRALLMIGYGTAFCADELDEGKRLADSPVDPVGMTKVDPEASRVNSPKLNQVKTSEPSEVKDSKPGFNPADFTINFGRKYKDTKIGMIPKAELVSYIQFLKSSAVRDGTALSYQVSQLIDATTKLYPDVKL